MSRHFNKAGPPGKPSWPKHKAYSWQKAPLLRPTLTLIVSVFIYEKSGWNIPVLSVLFTAVISMLVFFALQYFKRATPALNATRFLSLSLFLFCTGWLVATFLDVRKGPHWYGRYKNAAAYVVKISGAPKESAKTWKQEVTFLEACDQDHWKTTTGKAFLSLYKNDRAYSFHEGDTLIVPARFIPIKNSGNPFEFDYESFCHRQGIYGQAFLSQQEIARLGKNHKRTSSWITSTHNFCVAQLRRYVKDTASFGLLQAMLMGDEQEFDPELRQAYSDTGVVHIISISGSHTAVLFLVVTWLFFWIKKQKHQWIKYFIGVVLVWLYVIIAGAPPSALRSAVMFSAFALSFMTGRQQHSLNTLCMAAFVLLLAQPLFLFSVGFQLSFLAVLSLVLFYEPIYKLWPQATWLGRKTWQLVSASLAVEVLVAPLVIFYFHSFPLLVIFANIASVILVGFIALIGGLLILAFCWWPQLASFIGDLVSLFINLFNRIILWLQYWSPGGLRHLQLSLPELLLTYAAITLIALFFRTKKSPLGYAGLGLMMTLLTLCCYDDWKALHQQRLVVYNAYKKPLADLFIGNRFIPLAGNSSDKMAGEARIGFGAGNRMNERAVAFFLNGKKIVWIGQPSTVGSPVKVDVLLLADSLQRYDLRKVREDFSPQLLVITGSQSRWLVKKWKDSAVLLNQPLHATSIDGAYILE